MHSGHWSGVKLVGLDTHSDSEQWRGRVEDWSVLVNQFFLSIMMCDNVLTELAAGISSQQQMLCPVLTLTR